MQERRAATRTRTLLSAQVVIGSALVYDCMVRDMSVTGAKLVFATPTTLPDEFRLRVPKPPKSLWARVVWRKGVALGVEFVSDGLGAEPV